MAEASEGLWIRSLKIHSALIKLCVENPPDTQNF